MPKLTRWLLLLNLAAFAAQVWLDPDGELIAKFALWPWGKSSAEVPEAHFALWQLITSAFLHGSPGHLFTNMLALWMFGRDVERALGAWRFFDLYFAAVLSAALLQLAIVSNMEGGAFPTLGASGGVFGVLLAYGTLFPRRTVLLLFPPIPMRARTLVILYGAFELFQGVTGTNEGVAHFAHLGGMAGAWLLLRSWRHEELG
jgi:membrane associated rhomboid family serine protease